MPVSPITQCLASGQIKQDALCELLEGCSAALHAALHGCYEEALSQIGRLELASQVNYGCTVDLAYLKIRCCLAAGKRDAAEQLLNHAASLLHANDRHKLQCRIHISAGNKQEAAALLDGVLREDPQDWEALALLAALGGQQCESLFARSLAIFPEQADARRNRAMLRIQQQNLSGAVSDLQEALRFRPGFAPALELLHPLLMQQGDVATLHRHYSSCPDESWTPRLAGYYMALLQALGKADQAWEKAQLAMQQWPADLDLLLCAAAAAQAAGLQRKAMNLYRQLQEKAPPALAARALNNLALLAVNDGDLPQALELLHQACRLQPKEPDLQLHHAELLLRNGEQESAVDVLHLLNPTIVVLTPAQQRRWLLAQSRLLQRQGELEQALAVAKQARSQWPGQADTWLQEAAILADLQRLDEGINVIQQAAAQVEQPRELRDPLLGYLINQGRLAQASQLLEQWLQQDPDDPILLGQRAGLQIDLGNLEAAEEQLRNLAKRHPERGRIALSKFLLQRNRPTEVLAVCEQAITADPARLVPYQLAARALAQLQRWPEAIAMLTAAHEQDPERLDVLSNLVRLQLQQADPSAAMGLIEAELTRRPRLPLLRIALQVLQRNQNWSHGLALLAPLEQADPGNTELQTLKSRLLRRQGQATEALAITAALVAANPTNLILREGHIRELLLQEQFENAQQQAHALAAQLPDSPQRLLQLVALLKSADAPEQALQALQQEMGRWPDHPNLPWLEISLLERLSRTAEAQGRVEALVAHTAQPSAELLERASSASLRHRAYDAAARFAQQWQQCQPADSRALWQLFSVLSEQSRLDEAMALLSQIRERNPHDQRLDPTEASILIKQSRYESATRLLDRAIERNPTNQQLKDQRLVVRTSAGDFSSFDTELAELDRLRAEDRYQAHSNYFFNINCHPSWSAERVYGFHRDWYEKAIEPDLQPIPSYPTSQFDPQKRLKIGYVSGDFKRHAVAYFSEPLLIEHDRDQFEVYAFATHNPVESGTYTERFRSYVHHWVEAHGMDDGELYRKIRSLGIDILVDLSGHTGGSRLMVFARKPAPLQLSAVFGAGQTTGIRRVDYLLCDQVAVPPEHAPYLSEQRAELPFAGLPYKPGEDFIDPEPLPCLSGAPFTFACVTRPVRVNTLVCARWGQILAACPGANLVFEHGSYQEPEVQERYRSLLVAAGAEPGQIIFRNTRPYWELFHGVDLLLDPWPAGSGTVGTDALWMERLTLTLASRPVMGRLMHAQLTALGLDDRFSYASEEAYQARAIELASTASGRAELAATSGGLRRRLQASHLMDYQGYGKAVAQIYHQLWVHRCTVIQ